MAQNESTDSNKPIGKTPAPQLQQLNFFKGHWIIEGSNFGAAPDGGDSPVTGEMTNEWITGNFFMSTTWQYHFEAGEHTGFGALGFDETTGDFFVRNYDNLGYDRRYDISIYKNTWNFTGAQERATMVFDQAGDSYEENWEILMDGSWQPLCRRTGRKAQVTP